MLSRFILVMLITFMRYTPLKLFSWTPAPSSLHQTNYKQIVYSSVDPDQMAFGIQKEINLGNTRLNAIIITEACSSLKLNYYHIIMLEIS